MTLTIRKTPLLSKNQTGRSMYRIVEQFHGDLGPLAKLTLPEFFDAVKRIPYKADPKGKETVARPLQLLRGFPDGIDCKKKALLVASWLRAHDLPYRFVACSERADKKFHHVYPQGAIAGKWRNLDATYPKYDMFQKKPFLTKTEVLDP